MSWIAKITRPCLSVTYPRRRLFHLLDQAAARPITWIKGPPGSGKTTLVASYLDTRTLPSIWYQVDEGDADVATFFYYLGLAARMLFPGNLRPLPLLAPEHLGSISSFSRRYFRHLVQVIRPPTVLVIDNYHEAPAGSRLHEIIATGLTELPPGGRAILISHTDPPPAMARLIANQSVLVLGWDELRLTLRESNGIARLHCGRGLPKELLKDMHLKTQGWVAGLVLMLQQAKTMHPLSRPPGEFIPTRVLFNYFAAEVLQKTDPMVQDFLLKTAVLPRMTVGVAEKLTGRRDAGTILSELNRKNCFTICHHHSEPLYQYHPLFREFLQASARDAFGSGRLVRLKRKAAALLEAAGQPDDAIELLRETGDREEMSRIVINQAPALLRQGRAQTLSQWLGELPEEMLQRLPWGLYWLGASRLPFNPAESRTRFEQAFVRFRSNNDITGMTMACSGIIDAVLFGMIGPGHLDQWIPITEKLLTASPVFPSPDVEARILSSMFRALMIRQPGHPEIEGWAEQVLRASETAEEINLRMMSRLDVAFYYLFTGRLSQAARVIDSMHQLASSPRASPASLTMLKSVEAMYFMLSGERKPCLTAVSEGLKIARDTGVHIWSHQLMSHGVAGALSNGDLTAAGRLLRECSSDPQGNQPVNSTYRYCLSAWNAMLRGDMAEALQHQKTALELSAELGMPFIEGLSHFGMAQVLFEHKEHRKAMAHLAQARRVSRETKNRLLEFMCLLSRAHFALETGKERTGLRSLRQAMVLGREEGYSNFLWWRPSVMAGLCVKALRNGIEERYVQGLVRKRNLVPDSPPLDCEGWPWALKVYTLGRFELVRKGKPLRFHGRAQQRPLDLLKALIALGGRAIPVERLADALWPEAEGYDAYRAFVTTLTRLRRLVGHRDALQLQGRCLTLNARLCWVDVWAFERLLGEASTLKREELDKVWCLTEKAVGLYQGHFLCKDIDQPWAVSLRERTRSKFLRHVRKTGYKLCRAKWCDEAVLCYQKGLEADDLAEKFYQGLMKCYHCLGRYAETVAVYQRCQKTLAAHGIEPSSRTKALYKAVCSDKQKI